MRPWRGRAVELPPLPPPIRPDWIVVACWWAGRGLSGPFALPRATAAIYFRSPPGVWSIGSGSRRLSLCRRVAPARHANDSLASRYKRLDLPCGVLGVLVLPYANGLPPCGAQSAVGVLVTLGICSELSFPPISVCFGSRSMLRARVPEAAVDEDGHPLARERDVCATTKSRQWHDLDSVTQSE